MSSKTENYNEEREIIAAIKKAYARAHIELPQHDDDMSVDTGSLQDMLVNNRLHPSELQERKPLTFDIGIDPDGRFVYADCWIAGKHYAKKPLFVIGGAAALDEFVRYDFRGTASIVRNCDTVIELPVAIGQVVGVIGKIANHLRPMPKDH